VEGLAIEPGCARTLEEAVIVKRKSFMATECPPDPIRIAQEVARRRLELAGNGRFLLARVWGEPVGFISWLQDGPDWFINLLGVRVPFRRRGIGLHLVRALLELCYGSGGRMAIVVPDPSAIRLYQWAGFTEEVHWRHAYRLPARRHEGTVARSGAPHLAARVPVRHAQ
jgi:GNAT superfamily N-acetyltransferase